MPTEQERLLEVIFQLFSVAIQTEQPGEITRLGPIFKSIKDIPMNEHHAFVYKKCLEFFPE